MKTSANRSILYNPDRWYHNGVEMEGETGHTLVLDSVPKAQHGQTVECVASNSVDSIRHTYTLSVECKCAG